MGFEGDNGPSRGRSLVVEFADRGVMGVFVGSGETCCCVPDGGVAETGGMAYVRMFVFMGERLLICRACLLCCVSICGL